ncbi:KN motif and ankyrin repeat domain-containing protein 1-like [Scyliorhinus canicula]|uniref:KN motif and ankyrin repeat domain-containing protein 1-like n=1 Tax=Scyliorhinus canicula TaxID=7830 RepID=UPI0018F65182|nr:KN motif and ankyrin repeat domain-containing protein 1-like [Scyliorhinus canicula]XP_038650607.1 KN motif and ankyrin repeat domain-containing protein 1-like [Scyliorhinus canicula]XP_038650608.1 KN motif and ankyrin repeat domain-containing protein 1-like [Scyliorhinus canicula]XP_038650609.1 KN motif and ankyrin repeat domain-containing protein 1-like [Scyliorhinus canicula]
MSQVLQSPHRPANIKLSSMCLSADRKKESPYSVETPYGFHLDLDFLKYVDDIEKGNTIRKIKIHKKAKQLKCSTLPRNFSVPDTRYPSAESRFSRNHGDKGIASSSWATTNGCKVTHIKELFIGSPDNTDSGLSECNMNDCRSVKAFPGTKEKLKENGKFVPSWMKPPFLRAASMPIDFRELNLEEQCQSPSSFQQKLKCLESGVFRTSGDPVVKENSSTSETTPHSNLTPTQFSQIQQQVRIAQEKTEEMEEQVKTISELKKQIFVLQEENTKLIIQIKNQQSTVQNASFALHRKGNDNMDKTQCVNKGSQSNSSIAIIGFKGQMSCLRKSPSSEMFLSNDKFKREEIMDLNCQNEFASNSLVSENVNFDPIPCKELVQSSHVVGDIEHRMRNVDVHVTKEELNLVPVATPSTEGPAGKELRTTVSTLEQQLEAGIEGHKLEQQGAMLDVSKVNHHPETLPCDQSMQLERKHEQDGSEKFVISNQPSDEKTTNPELRDLKEKSIHGIDVQSFTQSVCCGGCTVNATVTTLKETQSLGVNTDRITVKDAGIMAAVETIDKATDLTVQMCDKAVETEHAPSLHCIPRVTGVSGRVNEEVKHTGIKGDNVESIFDNLQSNQTGSTDDRIMVIGNGKECPIAADNQYGECEKEVDRQNSDSQDGTLDILLQPETQLISANPEIEQCIKKIEDLLCKQQSFLEQNYPELAQNFKKVCSSIGSLSSQLMNSLQPLPSSDSTLNRAEESPLKKERDPVVFQSTTLKSIMKKKDGNFKSSGVPAKKNLHFIGVNGGYESTSSDDSTSSEESPGNDLEKECVDTGTKTQHTDDSKAETSKDMETTGHEEIRPTGHNAAGSAMENCSKRHESKLSLISACHNLKDHLNELGVTNDKDLRQNLNTVQWEWFRISSQKSAAPEAILDFLRDLREMSSELLHFIVNLTDENQNTALHYSVSHSNFHIVRLLLDTGMCNVDHQNKAGYTATMLASLASAETDEDSEVIMQLLHLGNINIQATQAGQTALMLAVSHGRINMVKALLTYGANVNIQDDDGSTALMCASEHGHVEIVKLLLAQPGCNAALTDKDDSTALTIALQAGQKATVELLNTHVDRGTSPTL